MEKRKHLKGYLFVAIAGSLWGIGGFFVTKMSEAGASSLMTAFAGHFLALPTLLIYLLAKKGIKGLKISKKGLLVSIMLGVLTKGIFKLSLDTSMILVGVATSTILMYLAPVWTAIMAIIFFKEKLKGYQVFALALNLFGCALMVTGGNFAELNISGLGLALGLIAGILYGLSTILGKIGTSGDDSVTMAFYMLLFSSLATAFFAKPWSNVELFANGEFLFWSFTGAGLSGTVANILFFKGLSMGIDASKTTIVASIEVVIATVAGVFLLNEKINVVGYVGIIIMLASIVLINMNIPTAKDSRKGLNKGGHYEEIY
jgi:DME family drug/metabolite transporter